MRGVNAGGCSLPLCYATREDVVFPIQIGRGLCADKVSCRSGATVTETSCDLAILSVPWIGVELSSIAP